MSFSAKLTSCLPTSTQEGTRAGPAPSKGGGPTGAGCKGCKGAGSAGLGKSILGEGGGSLGVFKRGGHCLGSLNPWFAGGVFVAVGICTFTGRSGSSVLNDAGLAIPGTHVPGGS